MIERGGTCEERLYLDSMGFTFNDEQVLIRRTDMPDMEPLVARHKARYHFVAGFCGYGMNVLDFPCGSGYGSEIFSSLGAMYTGLDIDAVTIEYCIHQQNPLNVVFATGDLRHPNLTSNCYDLIACIEGIEHIDERYQQSSLVDLRDALTDKGTLIVTTPSKGDGSNPYHLNEMTYDEFKLLLIKVFESVIIVPTLMVNHKGEKTVFMYGICRKEGGW